MDAKFNLTGADQLEAALRELAATVGDKKASSIGASAARAGMQVALDVAKQKVPKRTGGLQRSMFVQTAKRPESGVVVAKLAFRRPAGNHAHLIEKGTRFMPAQPFIRPAMDESHQKILLETSERLAAGIRRAMEKVAKGKG